MGNVLCALCWVQTPLKHHPICRKAPAAWDGLQEGSGCLGWFSCTEGSAGGTNPTQASKLGEFCGEPLRARVLDSSRQAPPLCEPQFPAL